MTKLTQVIDALSQQGISYKLEEPLAPHTSFKIGGNCRMLIAPASEEEARQAVVCCGDYPVLVLGNGSNVLVSDDGFDGIVILMNRDCSNIRLLDDNTIEAQAGASLMSVCRFALEHSLTGLEFAYGIPATVGGAVFMNAGAYGGEMKDVVVKANHVHNGKIGSFAGEELQFSYRHSAYSKGGYLILSAVFRLQKGNREEIQAKMEDLMGRRKSKQPLEYPSAGSTFKRPPNAFAAKLIEDCGLKGVSVGGAQVSEKHSGFVINTGGATCKDVQELIALVQKTVKEKSGIDLECEVRYIG